MSQLPPTATKRADGATGEEAAGPAPEPLGSGPAGAASRGSLAALEARHVSPGPPARPPGAESGDFEGEDTAGRPGRPRAAARGAAGAGSPCSRATALRSAATSRALRPLDAPSRRREFRPRRFREQEPSVSPRRSPQARGRYLRLLLALPRAPLHAAAAAHAPSTAHARSPSPVDRNQGGLPPCSLLGHPLTALTRAWDYSSRHAARRGNRKWAETARGCSKPGT